MAGLFCMDGIMYRKRGEMKLVFRNFMNMSISLYQKIKKIKKYVTNRNFCGRIPTTIE